MRNGSKTRTGSFLEVMDRLSTLFDELDAWSKRNSAISTDDPDAPDEKQSDGLQRARLTDCGKG